MSSRRDYRQKKKKKFVIIALVAIALAELGYILYSFGIFFTTTRPGGARPLAFLLYILCIQTGAGPGFCQTQTLGLLTEYSRYSYLAIRIVDVPQANITKLAKQLSFLENYTRPIVDVYLVGPNGESQVNNIVASMNKTLGGTLSPYILATFPVTNFTLYTRYILQYILYLPRKVVTPPRYTGTISVEATPEFNVTYVANSTLPVSTIIYNIAITFQHPIENILKELLNYVNFTGHVINVVKGNRTVTKMIRIGRILVLKYNSTYVLMRLVMYAGNLYKNSTAVLTVKVKDLKKAVVHYYVISLVQPTLILIGNKENYTINCLIAPYNVNMTVLKDMITQCIGS